MGGVSSCKLGTVTMAGGTGEAVKKLGKIAVPLAAVMLMQYAMQTTTVVMVGHLPTHSQLYLSASSLATTISRVTAYNFLVGMSGALETLAGQAYGAEQHKKVGILTQTAIVSQLLVCLPICIAWIFMDKLLVLTHQNSSIALETGKYMRWLLPSLFAQAFTQPLVRFFQSQSFTLPIVVSTIVSSCSHILVSWLLMFRFQLGFLGSALSVDISSLLQSLILGFFAKYSSSCAMSRAPLSSQAFGEMRGFLRLALPSALMLCLEYWAFQAITLMAGLLHNPTLEISVLTICMNTLGLFGQIPSGIGGAASTRVSNELGAGNAEGACAAVRATFLVIVVEMSLATSTLYLARRFIGHLYTKDNQVVGYFSDMAPFVCASLFLDNFVYVLTGIVRGCGLQKVVTYINFGAYFACGLPTSILLGFVFHFGGKGLWGGIILGAALQTIAIVITLSLTDWDNQVTQARERVAADNGTNVSMELAQDQSS